ncbi:hypothetical protein R1T16_05325 [Flavobacterium sp. DG1-102-2]|uniref:Ig-like domain-containing protein n=1 Tax=Flavobacterium sp. DG1-102-2 TaxID=3081663 RepID=UPI0029492A16|nr:hypothetical protein [Flavobacterium sp. DG1-102-2]MDV6167835.1 hypothetical protein [Flavobacterium sp. DG1-102-2]
MNFLYRALLLLGLFLALGNTTAFAQFAITENFRGSGNPDIIIGGGGGTEGTAYLTSGVNDPVNAGWLRLTNSTSNQKGYAYVNKSFPSTLGVLVDFEYKMWRNTNDSYNGADGIGVFLYDASSTFALGGYGGSLGYAPIGGSGLAGGYVGVGLDAYGNFSNPTEGRIGGPGYRPNAVALRGPTTASTSTTNRFLAGKTITTADSGVTFSYGDVTTTTGVATQNALDYNTVTTTRPTDAQFYRRVQLEITRLDAAGIYYNVIVRWKTSPTGAFVYVTDYTTTDVPPGLLKLGFAASTGGGVNYHEIRNLLVTTPGNLRIVKRADKDILRTNNAANSTITYTIEVTNDTNFEIPQIEFTDRITDSYGNLIPEGTSGFDITSITTSGFVTAAMPNVASLTTNEISGTLVLAANTTAYITIVGRLYTLPDGSILQNTASAIPPLDEDLNNNTSIVRTPVTAENVDLLLTKMVTEQCITSPAIPKFTVYVSNNGAVATSYRRLGINGTRVAFYNVVPPGYTYDDSSTPGGFAGSQADPVNSDVTARWSKIILNNTPSNGYTTIGYIARGTAADGSAQTLGSGSTYPYPVTYTVQPSTGTTSYVDTTTALLFTDYNYGQSIETTDNQANNNASINMYIKPAAPTVPPGTLNYCVDEDAPLLTATATGSNTLRWYMTANGFSSEFPIKPYTGASGTYTYYVSQVNGDCEGPKTPITVIVGPSSTGSISVVSPATCPGSTVLVSGTAVTGATYAWQSATEGGTFTTISGATGQNYISVALTETTYFRRLVTLTANGKTCTGPGNFVKVFIPTPGLIGNSQSGCTTFDPNAFTNITGGTTGTIDGIAYTYKWQISNDGTTNWTDISGGGTTSATYDSPSLSATRYFRRVIRYTVSGNTCSNPSNVVVAYVGPNNTNNTPDRGNFTTTPTTVCSNTVPGTLSNTDAGDPGYYIWEYSTDGGATYTLIQDANPASSSYTPTTPLTVTTRFSRRISNGCNTSNRRTRDVTVLTPTPGTIGTTQTICYNTAPAQLTASANGNGIQYRWEVAEGTSGGSWSTAPGTSNGANYSPGPLTTSKRYRRINISTSITPLLTCESDPSNVVTIIVKPQTDAGTITGAQNICNGGAASPITGTAASSVDAFTYQWEVSATGANPTTATGWSNAVGNAAATSQQNYTPTVTGYYRRRTTTTACGSLYSNVVYVSFQPAISAGTMTPPAATTICYNTAPGQIVGSAVTPATGTTITYRWESSANAAGPFTTAAGTSNGVSYTSPALTATRYFRRIVISTINGNACESPAPTPIMITVQDNVGVGSISGPAIGCPGTSVTIASDVSGTGSGSITYRWETAGNPGGTYTVITGETGPTLTINPFTTNASYRRYTISTQNGVDCTAGPSNIVTVSLPPFLTAGTISASASRACSGTTVLLNNNLSGGNFTSYQWQYSTTGSPFNWVDIPGANSATYTTFPLTATTYFQRLAFNQCGSKSSGDIHVDVTTINPGTIGPDTTICNNTSPGTLGGTSNGSSNAGGVTYRWESAAGATGGSFSPIGQTTASYTPGNLTSTIRYRRYTINTANSVTCEAFAEVLITVLPAATPGTIGVSQTICYNTAPQTITTVSGSPATGTGTITYLWESASNTGGPWSSTGVTTESYTPGALTATTYYRRVATATSGTLICSAGASNTVTISVQGQINPGTLTPASNQSICAGATPSPLTNASDASVSNALPTTAMAYRWEYSAGGNTGWAVIPTGTTNGASYTFTTGVSTTTYYRRVAVTTRTPGNTVCEMPSATVVVTVSAPQPGSIAANQTICFGTQPALLTSATGGAGTGPGTMTYQWYMSTDNTNFNPIGGATAETYQEPSTLTGTRYYKRLTNSNSNGTNCQSGFTNTISVTVAGQVNSPGSLSSSNQYICYGATADPITSQDAGSVPAPGTISYVWQSSTDNGANWSADIAGATGANYTPTGAMTQNILYRRLIVGNYGTTACRSGWGPQIAINVATVATGGTIGNDQTVCSGNVPPQTINITNGTNANRYLWQVSTDNMTWTDIAGAQNSVYQPTAPITVTTYYRRFGVSNLASTYCTGTVPSNVITMTVPAIPTPGSIGSNQNVCGNAVPALLTSVTPGAGGTSYQWQESYDNSYWANLTGATSATYQPGALGSSRYYRRLNMNGSCPSAPSNVVFISVNVYPNPGGISADQSICAGSIPATITGDSGWAGGGTGTFRWYSSTDGTTWTYTGVTTQNFTFSAALAATTYYRRGLTSSPCYGEVYSNTVTITVSAAPTGGTIAADQTVCSGSTAATLTSSVAGSSTNYRWETASNASGPWATAIGTNNGATYSPGVLPATTYFRRVTISASCSGEAYSNTITITVTPLPSAGTISADQTVCSGNTPATLTGTAGATTNYRWDTSTNGGTTWNATTVTTANYTFSGALAMTTSYRRATISGSCEGYSNTITVAVVTAPTGGSVMANQTICYNTTPAALNNSTAGTGSGGFTYRWEAATNTAGPWATASGTSNGAGYTPTSALTVTTYYRRVTIPTAGSCVAYSNTITISVAAQTTAGSIGAAQNICMDTTPAVLGSATTGAGTGSGTITYRWEVSLNGSTGWAVIPGETGVTYQPPVLHSARYYRRTTLDAYTANGNTANCESGTTPVVAVTTKNCKVITNPMIYQRVKN